jgi:hypothetical protein
LGEAGLGARQLGPVGGPPLPELPGAVALAGSVLVRVGVAVDVTAVTVGVAVGVTVGVTVAVAVGLAGGGPLGGASPSCARAASRWVREAASARSKLA